MGNSEPEVRKIIAQNRKARHDYFIIDSFEAGIVLTGSEVKSLRDGKANLLDSYADENNGAIFLKNCHISEYKGANRFNHEPNRPRKLLLHKKEIQKLIGKVKTKGLTLVPLSLYFNNKNMVKVELALVQGKKQHDKREADKQRDWSREKARLMRD